MRDKGNEIRLRNLTLAVSLMENSETAKIVGLSFTAGVAVGWFLHSYMLKKAKELLNYLNEKFA